MKIAYKYQVVGEQRQPFGHMLYLLRYTTTKDEHVETWVGMTKLRRMYKDGKIIGPMSHHVNYIVGNEPKKPGRVKKVKLTPRVNDEEVEPSEIIKMANSIQFKGGDKAVVSDNNPKMYSLPDVFVVEPLVRYKAIKTAKGWDVIDSNGEIMMDDMNEEMAKDYANELNKNNI